MSQEELRISQIRSDPQLRGVKFAKNLLLSSQIRFSDIELLEEEVIQKVETDEIPLPDNSAQIPPKVTFKPPKSID